MNALTACIIFPLPELPPAPRVTATAVPATATTGRAGVDTPTAGPTTGPAPATATAGPQVASPEPGRQAQACYQMRSTAIPRDSLGDALFPQLGNSGYDVTH
jgi:hypothetical protein